VKGSNVILTVDGSKIHGVGEAEVAITIESLSKKVRCLVMSDLVLGYDVIVGMDVIYLFGGVNISKSRVQFEQCQHVKHVAVALSDWPSISDKDFEAVFDGEKWTVSWKWRNAEPILKNNIDKYAMNADVQGKFESELEKWIDEGWLVPCGKPNGGIVPLMAVTQVNKKKVRPILDYRELNQYVESFTGESDVCCETLRKWRKMGGEPAVLDLKKRLFTPLGERGLAKIPGY
jgi:hypothetical protein